MRRTLLALPILAVACPVMAFPAWAEDAPPLAPSIDSCLRANAAKVEAAEPDLTKATDYLVGTICALPIAQEQQRLNQQRAQDMAQRQQQQCEARVADQKKQFAGTNPNRTYENCSLRNNFTDLLVNMPALNILANTAKPAAAVSLAGKLMLDLRLAHLKQAH